MSVFRKFKPLKLTTRITISNVVLFTLIIMVIVYFVTLLTNQFLFYKNREELINKQQQIEELLGEDISSIYVLPKKERIRAVYNKLERYYMFENYKTLIALVDSDGQTTYTQNRGLYDKLIMDHLKINPDTIRLKTTLEKNLLSGRESMMIEVFQSTSDSEQVKIIDGSFFIPTRGADPFVIQTKIMGYDLMYTTLRKDFGNNHSLYILVFLYPELDQDFIISLNSALLVSALIGVLLFVLFGKYFTKRALKPLVDLSYVAQNINNETLNYRIPPTESKDEIDTLISSLNRMLENLEDSFEYQRRFVSDASHELRIPLTIVLGYIDVLKTIGKDNPELLDESMHAIEDEAGHMKNLVEKLLILARFENQKIKVNYAYFNVSAFVERSIIECERLYPDHVFVSKVDPKLEIHADTELMVQIMRALVENAVKYSEPGTNISFDSEIKDRFIVLSLTDEGRGIPQESIPNLTNRFYRLSEDRNRKTGGSGLGLSIVEVLVKAHGGFVRFESTLDIGTKVMLFFPR